MSTITISGLRSHKLFGKDYNDSKYIDLIKFMIIYLYGYPNIEKVNIGMATGIDLLFGIATIKFNNDSKRNIKLDCYIPGMNQTNSYNETEKKLYDYILQNANKVNILSEKECSPEILKKRSKIMVDNCDEVLAFWNDQKYKSGTYSTINYAWGKDIPVYIVNPFNTDLQYKYNP